MRRARHADQRSKVDATHHRPDRRVQQRRHRRLGPGLATRVTPGEQDDRLVRWREQGL